MSNPLFETLGGTVQQPGLPPILEEFKRIRQTYKGDARAEVQKLLQSGRMSQAQFNELGQMVNQLMGLMK